MGELLYHYSTTQSAFAMLQPRAIRLSPLSAANDSLEGRLVGRVFAEALKHTGLAAGVTHAASIVAQGYADATEGFAFCLSEAGDLLNQWRAYADGGCGIAVGFDPSVLTQDFGRVNFGSQYFELLKVAYGEESSRAELEAIAC